MAKLPDINWRIQAYNELVNAGIKVQLDDRMYGMPTKNSGDVRLAS